MPQPAQGANYRACLARTAQVEVMASSVVYFRALQAAMMPQWTQTENAPVAVAEMAFPPVTAPSTVDDSTYSTARTQTGRERAATAQVVHTAVTARSTAYLGVLSRVTMPQ